MESYIITFLSVLISVVLFLIGYRQTVGAYEERVRAANTDLEKVFLKKIILESYKPTTDDLSRLINGKAQDHRVRTRDLLSQTQLLETLFTRIFESDFINTDQRDEILKRLSPILLKAEEAPVEEIRAAELRSREKRLYSRTYISVAMAVLAAIGGTLVAFSPALGEATKLLIPSVIAAFVVSLAIIIMIVLVYRRRESQEETSIESAFQSKLDFEREVSGVLNKLGATSKLSRPGTGFDFMTTVSGKKILIEVKAWSASASIAIIRHLVDKLSQAIRAYGADEAIIVTKAPVHLPPDLLKDTSVRIMSLREFRNYMAHGGMK